MYPFANIKDAAHLEEAVSDPYFKDALYIATPVLYKELFAKEKKTEKELLSAVKYYSRSCTRCTPYGLFAGCDVVPVDPDARTSAVHMGSIDRFKTYSRVDMNYLGELIRILDQMPAVKNKLAFHPNTTLYDLGKNIRYIEYKINQQSNKRDYIFSEVERTRCLGRILAATKKRPMTIDELADLLVRTESVEKADAVEFVETLIKEQIIVSSLEPSVVGDDLITQLSANLSRLGISIGFIQDLIALLKECDRKPIGEKAPLIDQIYSVLHGNISFKQDTILHVDTLNRVDQGVIGGNVVQSVKKGISLLERMNVNPYRDAFADFKAKFYDKYEEQEVPLVVALDSQVGIGYGRWTEFNSDINPLLKGLPIPAHSTNTNPGDNGMDPMTRMLIKKYEESIKKGASKIEIFDEDVSKMGGEQMSMPQCSVMFSVLSNDDTPSILLKGISGGATSRYFSRFEYLDPRIEDLVNRINKKDDEVFEDSIVAEVSHLPEDRIGNIQMHPVNRDYTICYLSNPEQLGDHCIPIDDIMISVPYGQRIVLRSKKLKKPIIPMLSTAHNTAFGLPIYSFLSDYVDSMMASYVFNWGQYFQSKEYLPRVVYSNLILKPARWSIMPDRFPKDMGPEGFMNWRKELSIPDEVLLSVGDNQLYIDMNNDLLKQILFQEFAKKRPILLEEFLYRKETGHLVVSDKGFYTNEVMMNFYRV